MGENTLYRRNRPAAFWNNPSFTYDALGNKLSSFPLRFAIHPLPRKLVHLSVTTPPFISEFTTNFYRQGCGSTLVPQRAMESCEKTGVGVIDAHFLPPLPNRSTLLSK
nr:hypothetical protein Q903MT_gene464 [Picea sitchensis]